MTVGSSLPREEPRAARSPRAHRRVVRIDDLAVTCWCEATVVHVPREVVLEGRTESCGSPDCNEAAA